MEKSTLAQANQILNLIQQQDVSKQNLQSLIESGLLVDLLDADFAKINRSKFLEALGFTGGKRRQYTITTGIWNIKDLINLIEQKKHFDINNHTETFAVKKCPDSTHTVPIDLFRGSFTSEFFCQLGKRDFRPCCIEEFLAFFVCYPTDIINFIKTGRKARKIVTIINDAEALTNHSIAITANDKSIFTHIIDDNFKNYHLNYECWFASVRI